MLVNVETSKLTVKALRCLAEGTMDTEMLKTLYCIDDPELHKTIIKNYYIDEELVRKMYEHYSKLNYEEMIRKIFYSAKTPEDIIIEILQTYKKMYNRSFGYLDELILHNECITEKAISVIYSMYKSGEIEINWSLFAEIVADNRTGVEVLTDVLSSQPKDEILCIIAKHPKMKIVPASE